MSDLRLVSNEWLLQDVPDINNLGWITADITDGTWTESDPSGAMLSSKTVVSEVTTINLNAVGSSNQTYSFQNGANFTGPRWYTELNDTDGTRISSADAFTVFFQIVQEAPTSQQKVALGICICEDPTATANNTIKSFGNMLEYNTTGGDPIAGIFYWNGGSTNSASSNGGANLKYIFGSAGVVFSGLVGTVTALGVDSDGDTISNRLGNAAGSSTAGFADSTNLFLTIMAGTNGTTTTGAGDIKAKLRYRVVKFNATQA
jgi:hypothetical protein